MSLLNSLLGNASEVSISDIQNDLSDVLITGEGVQKVFKLFRDMYVFTNKRLIMIDKQGLTGSKAEFLSIPYRSITRFSKENAGTLDMDAEFRIWIKGDTMPLVTKFKKGSDIDTVYRVMSEYVLA